MSAPSGRHAEMHAHARMSALIDRRTAFIQLNGNFHFQLLQPSLRHEAVCQEESSRRAFSPKGFPRCRNEPVLPGADNQLSFWELSGVELCPLFPRPKNPPI